MHALMRLSRPPVPVMLTDDEEPVVKALRFFSAQGGESEYEAVVVRDAEELRARYQGRVMEASA